MNDELKADGIYGGENGFKYVPVRQASPSERKADPENARMSDYLRISYVDGQPVGAVPVEMIEADTPGKVNYANALRDKSGQGKGVKAEKQADEVVIDVGDGDPAAIAQSILDVHADYPINLTAVRVIVRPESGKGDRYDATVHLEEKPRIEVHHASGKYDPSYVAPAPDSDGGKGESDRISRAIRTLLRVGTLADRCNR